MKDHFIWFIIGFNIAWVWTLLGQLVDNWLKHRKWK